MTGNSPLLPLQPAPGMCVRLKPGSNGCRSSSRRASSAPGCCSAPAWCWCRAPTAPCRRRPAAGSAAGLSRRHRVRRIARERADQRIDVLCQRQVAVVIEIGRIGRGVRRRAANTDAAVPSLPSPPPHPLNAHAAARIAASVVNRIMIAPPVVHAFFVGNQSIEPLLRRRLLPSFSVVTLGFGRIRCQSDLESCNVFI